MIDHNLLKNHAYGLVAAEHLETLPSGIAHIPLASGIMDDSISLMPSLIELSQLNEAKSLELLELMDSQINDDEMPVISTLIKSDYDLKRIKSYFARVQICSNFKGGRAWLRVHDPRVLMQLKRALKKDTYIKVCAPGIWTIYVDGQWVQCGEAIKPSDYQPFSTLALDDQEWATVGRIGVVNRSLRKLGFNNYAQVQEHSAALDQLIAYAQGTYALTRIDDLVDYACLAWNKPSKFDAHPIAKSAIVKYQSQIKTGELDANDTSVINAFETLTASDWSSIRQDLNLETNKTTR
jgi:hypothetical protein